MSPEMRFISIFNLTIIALGTLSNLFTLSICLRKRLRTAPTFVFIAFNAFIETIPLYVRNLDNALQVVFGWFLRDKWWFACRVTLFFHYFPLQTSAWLLVTLSIDRYLSIKFTSWRKVYMNSKRSAILSVFIIIWFACANFVLLFSPSFNEVTVQYNNETILKTSCNEGFIAVTWAQVNTYMYSLIPFGILVIMNSLLLFEVIRKKAIGSNIEVEKAKRRSLTITVIIITLIYILLTAPIAIGAGYFLVEISKIGLWVLQLLSAFRYAYHSIGFFLLLASNKRFSEEVKSILCKSNKNKTIKK